MKNLSSFKITERERRYPILTVLDLAFHHFLVAGVVMAGMVLCLKLMYYHSPQLTAQAFSVATRVLGLGID